MNIVEIAAPASITQVPQAIKTQAGKTVRYSDGTTTEKIAEEIPITRASKAEARHSLQYLLLRQ